jgi:chorismate mutase
MINQGVKMIALRGSPRAKIVIADQPEAIIFSMRQLLAAVQSSNPTLYPGELASVFFTMTGDLCVR